MRRRKPSCAVVASPHALVYPRLYPCGWRCTRHTPAALKGQPEAPTGPGWPVHRRTAEADTPDTEQDQEQQS